MEKIKVFTLNEICEYLKKERPDSTEKVRFQREGFRCYGAGERGMGGLSRTAKFVPESIHIIVAPLACVRHCDFDLKLNGYTENVYSLFLTEKEIVGGKVADVLKECIVNLLENQKTMPKVITITVTCVDSLIHSDYTALKKWLKKQYGIRFGVVEMFPILADNTIKHTDMFVEMVYSLIEADVNKPKKKLINLLGRIEIPDSTTDFYNVLRKAGYEVREIRECKSLSEFDEMGEACLNIVLSEFNLYAAKMMEKKYGIPYFFWNECMNPDSIKNNYEELERRLNCNLDIEELYQEALKKAAEVRKAAEGKSFAIGQRLDYVPIKAACDLVAVGIEVKYVFVDKFQKADLLYYEEMLKNSPTTHVYLAPDISMRNFIQNPEVADVLLCGSFSFVKNVEGILPVNLSEEPYDFLTFKKVADQLLLQLQGKNSGTAQRQNQKKEENMVFERSWKTYPKEV